MHGIEDGRETARARGTRLGLLALALVAATVLWRFPLRAEAYLGGDRLADYAPFREAGKPRARNALDQDPVLCTFPREASLAKSLRAGEGAPRWEPGLGAGEPAALVNATAPDYPPWRLAYRLLPAWAAHASLVLCHLALALSGAFLLLRARGKRADASLAGAVVYGLTGQLSSWLELDLWTIAASWIPWALLGVELALARGARWIGLAALALGAAVLGGHLQIAALGVALAVLYALFVAPGPLPKRAVVAVLAAGLGLAIGAARLVPALTELRESTRERIPFERWHDETASLLPARLSLLLAPDLLGDPVAGTEMTKRDAGELQANPQELRFSPGVVALALALAAATRRKNAGLSLLALGALAVAMPTLLSWPLWRFGPGFGSTAPTRALAVFPLLAALLAAEGFELWRDGSGRARTAAAATLGRLLAIAAIAASGPELQALGSRAFLKPLALSLAGVAMVFSTREKPGRVARAALLSLIVFDAVEATVRWNPASPPELLYRETPALGKLREVVGRDRFLADRGVPPDVLLPLGMRGIGSYGSSHPARFAHLVDAIAPKRSGRPSNQWLHAWRLPPAWRDALSVRAVLVDPLDREGPEACVPEGLVPLSAGEVSIFRNPTALPRARLFPLARIVAAENETEALVRVRARDFDARTHVVLELGDSFSSWTPGDPLESGPLLEAAIVEGADGPERVRVRTGHREGAFLVLADTFASGWSATVDGTPAEIFPANVAFRAVFVPRGEHDVLFSYGPPGWPIAPAVSALACVAALACLALGNVRRPGLRARRAG